MNMLLAIACGGALGAVGRHYVAGLIMRTVGLGFPYGTLVVNILGCFAMGVLVEFLALKWSASQEVRAFLTVGLLGGFTTFSTFSLEVVLLFERGELGQAGTYVLASVILSVTGLFAGLGLMRWALA